MTKRLLLRASLASVLASLFILSLLPTPAAAEPGVPYCAGSVSPVPAPAPMVIMPEVCEQATGRVFPEASANSLKPGNALPGAGTGVASDYVSYFEFQAGLQYLAESTFGQKYLTVHQVGDSFGLVNAATQQRDHFPIYMLELTNKESPIPLENRQSMLFMLSIHGNEKGGREGGFRVLEDLVKGIGFAAEGVQGGAGLPTPIVKPSGGGNVETYHDYLDFMRVFLLFPNADGWAHDETTYAPAHDDMPLTCTGLFCRHNGNGKDLNRQAPTSGWQDPARNMVGEPESIGYYNWMLTQNITWGYAIDIHGMLQHTNFAAIMLPAGAMTPQEMQRSIRLAETLKDRFNAEADGGHFNEWVTVFRTGEQAGAATAAANPPCNTAGSNVPPPFGPFDCPFGGSALSAAGSSQFAEYYTVIDAIGYTDSGFNGDYFAQDSGLNAPGYDIELAYNHMVSDSQYAGPGSVFNDYHVKMVREIVKSFMDAAALDVKISFETQGKRTLYLEPTYVATSLDDFVLDENGAPTSVLKTPGGWADENPGDDLWDYGTNGGFTARPAKYWDDLKPFVRNGDEPGVLTKATHSTLTRAQLNQFDQLVIPGSAIKDIETDTALIADIRAWAEAGGNLVLTDEALRFFDLSGLTTDAVDVLMQYMGGAGMDLTHPMFYEYQDTSAEVNRNVRGGVKQTYEPTPVGIEEGANAAPNWFIDPAKFQTLGGEVAGTACGTRSLSDRCSDNGIGIGKVKVGAGQIQFMGSLLPDPTEEFYHPYGLDAYATTYSGNQILRNMLYWGNVIQAPPVVISADGEIVQSENEPGADSDAPGGTGPGGKKKDTPALQPLAMLGALLAAVAISRRRW